MRNNFNEVEQSKHFTEHIAKFTDYGNIKILDFAKPGSSHYRIRFLFEEDYYRLHISGDLGELIACNFNNMTFEGFKKYFANDPSYFAKKIQCNNRNIYEYDYSLAEEEIKQDIQEYAILSEILKDYGWDYEDKEYAIQDYIDDVLKFYDSRTGLDKNGYEVIGKYIRDYYPDYGVYQTGIIDLYLYAFKLAVSKL